MTSLLRAFLVVLVSCAITTESPCAFAAATISEAVRPPAVNVGDQVEITLTLKGGSISDINLPAVDGLQVVGTRSSMSVTFANGALARNLVFNYLLVPSRAGDFTIPAFDIHTDEGDLVHVKAMTFHAAGQTVAAASDNSSSPGGPSGSITSAIDPNGPVMMPPTNSASAVPSSPVFETSSDTDTSAINPPREKDGSISKVFIIVTPETTDAYVGQSVPMKIEFFIRMDVNADQNSLPTIKGSDFLINSFITRGHLTIGMIEGQQYERETWYTAIAAPKSGDFPLSMERDTYWVKGYTSNNFDPFGGFLTRHANLAHAMVESNTLTMHIQPLPTDGRPENFTGAIGHFDVTGDAQPASIALGEPFMLYFSVSGEGNFDYVRCPTLPASRSWKTYVPTSKINYRDEAHTHAIKMFEQAAVPNTTGVLQLPSASFSYFDPVQKKYITLPIPLAPIEVTDSASEAAVPQGSPGTGSGPDADAHQAGEMSPNRVILGALHADLTPVYRHAWFWIAQSILAMLPVLGLAFLLLRNWTKTDANLAERERLELFRREEEAMAEAARRGDAAAFFTAARHALQLQLGSQWGVKPESLTLREIRSREPELAARLEPFFVQADEVIYSGRAGSNLDLAEWERRARELLQMQPT